MSLVLRLRPGDDFYVAEERVVVGELLGDPGSSSRSTAPAGATRSPTRSRSRCGRSATCSSPRAAAPRPASPGWRSTPPARSRSFAAPSCAASWAAGDGRMPVRRGPCPEVNPGNVGHDLQSLYSHGRGHQAGPPPRPLWRHRQAPLARRAALGPVHQRVGNRRFLDFALTVEGDRVVWVNRIGLLQLTAFPLRCVMPGQEVRDNQPGEKVEDHLP